MEKRFFIVNHNCVVEVVGNFEDEGNLSMFGLTCDNQDYADIMASDLEPIVAFMNEQDSIIKEQESIINNK